VLELFVRAAFGIARENRAAVIPVRTDPIGFIARYPSVADRTVHRSDGRIVEQTAEPAAQ